MTLFLRLLNVSVSEKARVLRQAIAGDLTCRFDLDPSIFRQIPGSPFAYWASHRIRATFRRFPPFESNGRAVRQGLATADDSRFVRAWWEVSFAEFGKRWFGFAKGGSFSPYYAEIHLVVNWAEGGTEIKNNLNERGEVRSNVWMLGETAANYFFRPGLTWPLRARRFAPQILPAGCIFSVRGYCAFTPLPELTTTLAIFNSSTFDYLFKTMLGRFGYPEFIVGVLQRLPWAAISREHSGRLNFLSRRAWVLKRTLDTVNETSRVFLLPVALRSRLGRYDPQAIESELVKIQLDIDERAFRTYELAGQDRAAIETCLSETQSAPDEGGGEIDPDAGKESEERDKDEDISSTNALVTLHSWAVGVAFGRFDLQLATGERQPPPEPEPFDPLPTRSPGMVPETNEAQMPVRPMLVDDLGHSLDVTVQVGAVLERVGFAPESPEVLRRWLARDFFSLHIKMYSKSRRKAPIYWQLATSSASYSVWLYIHAFSHDTLYKVQETAAAKLLHEERRLESLRSDCGPNPKAAERQAFAAQEIFIEELRTFLEEVKRIAPLWDPNLDDGVIINFAPLWRLVPHHKPWQKELRATWDTLCAGEYDWAHLAMHLWPERVVPKCATDRSLAIAHGLEDVFWEQVTEGKWKALSMPTRPVEELVRERISSAVKMALKSLLEAPLAMTNGGRGRSRGRRKETGEAV